MKPKKWYAVFRDLSLLTQFGISLVTPLLLMTAGAWWLKNRFGWADWTILIGILLGLCVSACTFANFVQYVERRSRRDRNREK